MIEEVGIDDSKETKMIQERLGTATRSEVRRDLELFDVKFASGVDAASHCSAAIDTTSRSTSTENSDVGSTWCTSDTSKTALAVPSGSFQFQSDWKQLKDRPEEFYVYFKVVVNSIVVFCSQNN